MPKTSLEAYLAKKTHSSKLVITHQEFSADEFTLLINHIKNNKHLMDVSIRHCQLCDNETEKIIEALAENTCIRNLDLANNKISDAGLFLVLKNHPTLRSLNLSHNDIRNVEPVGKLMQQHRNLRLIYLAYNRIVNADPIIKAMKDYRNLLDVNLSANYLNVDQIERLLIAFNENKNLLNMHLLHNPGISTNSYTLDRLKQALYIRSAENILSIIEGKEENLKPLEIKWIRLTLDVYQARAKAFVETIDRTLENFKLSDVEINTILIVKDWLATFVKSIGAVFESLKNNRQRKLVQHLGMLHFVNHIFSVMNEKVIRGQYVPGDAERFVYLLRVFTNASRIETFKTLLPLLHIEKATLAQLYNEIFSYREYLLCGYLPQTQDKQEQVAAPIFNAEKTEEIEKFLIKNLNDDLSLRCLTYFHLFYVVKKLEEYYLFQMKKNGDDISFYQFILGKFSGKVDVKETQKIGEICRKLDELIHDESSCKFVIDGLSNINCMTDGPDERYDRLNIFIFNLKKLSSIQNKSSWIAPYKQSTHGFYLEQKPSLYPNGLVIDQMEARLTKNLSPSLKLETRSKDRFEDCYVENLRRSSP